MEIFVPYAHAAVNTTVISTVLNPIITNVINPIIGLVFIVAVTVFVWGVLQMILHADNSDARDASKRHILYGSIGMVIMLSAWGIIHLISSTVGQV